MNMVIIKMIRILHGNRCLNIRERRAGCAVEQGRCGLTLIEILVATTLMATLLVALWSLVGIYASLRGKGESHAGRVGNVSVMMQQLEDDLRNLPEVRPQSAARVRIERETGPVNSEIIAFDEAYDDEPAVETLSESAVELEGSGRRSSPIPKASTISQDADFALSEEGSFDSRESSDYGNLGAGDFESNYSDTGPSARQQAQACRTRSEEDCANSHLIPANPVAPSWLIGDEQSLTLANLKRQVPRQTGEGPAKFPHDLYADSVMPQGPHDYELGYGSAATQYGADSQVSGDSGAMQLPVRFVRYWLAGVIPLVAQTAAAGQDSLDLDGMTPSLSNNGSALEVETTGAIGKSGAAGERDLEERISGFYREEIVDVTAPVQMGSLRGRSFLENLSYGSMNEPSVLSGSSGMDFVGEMESSKEVIRRSFHLAQVEWAKFRYFDGTQWTSAWDSRVRRELPVAIEMSLWLLRLNGKQTSSQVATQNPPATGAEMAWSEADSMSESSTTYPLAEQEPKADSGGLFSASDDNPIGRQPEVRQLVVLRAAPLSEDTLHNGGLLSDGLPGDGLRGDE